MHRNLFNVAGKLALVTGSTQGIGRSIAVGLAQHGATVIINGRDPARCDATAHALCADASVKAVPCAFDVTDSAAVRRGVDQIEATIGPIDILINNAGLQRAHPFTEYPEQDWDLVVATNQKGVFLVAQSVARHMKSRQRGKIVNICSIQGEVVRENSVAYAATKGAIKQLTKSMCVELAKFNIQTNGIGPGYFDTELTAPLVQNKAFTERLCQRTPAGRWGQPEELVGAALFLSSEASNFVNGHVLYVDGGMLAAV